MAPLNQTTIAAFHNLVIYIHNKIIKDGSLSYQNLNDWRKNHNKNNSHTTNQDTPTIELHTDTIDIANLAKILNFVYHKIPSLNPAVSDIIANIHKTQLLGKNNTLINDTLKIAIKNIPLNPPKSQQSSLTITPIHNSTNTRTTTQNKTNISNNTPIQNKTTTPTNTLAPLLQRTKSFIATTPIHNNSHNISTINMDYESAPNSPANHSAPTPQRISLPTQPLNPLPDKNNLTNTTTKTPNQTTTKPSQTTETNTTQTEDPTRNYFNLNHTSFRSNTQNTNTPNTPNTNINSKTIQDLMKQIESLTAIVTQLQAEKNEQQTHSNTNKKTVTYALNQRSSHTQTSFVSNVEMFTLPQQIERCSSSAHNTKNNHTNTSTQTDSHSGHQYDSLLAKYRKQYNAKLRYNNHHNIISTHINNNTEPACISPKCWHIPTNMFNSFDLQRKIENAVIKTYMSETANYISNSITTMTTQLNTLSEQLSVYHNDTIDIKTQLEKIHAETPVNLAESIEKSWAKVQKIIVQKHHPSLTSPTQTKHNNTNQPTIPQKSKLNHQAHNTRHNQPNRSDYHNNYHRSPSKRNTRPNSHHNQNQKQRSHSSNRNRSHSSRSHSSNRSRSPHHKPTQSHPRK